MSIRLGATPEDWTHWQRALGRGVDLLPVVSNPHARISPNSSLKALGKVPSRYNGAGHAAGIKAWTSYEATEEDIELWRNVSDYGICVQTRFIRALDVDVDGPMSPEIRRVIRQHFGKTAWRTRLGSDKFLVPFAMAGIWPKRALQVHGGIIEFLGTGQQFVAHGTHTSGVRYVWPEPPDEMRSTTGAEFEALWQELELTFGLEVAAISNIAKDRKEKLNEAAKSDPVAACLESKGMVFSARGDGGLNIRCPFSDEHTVPLAGNDASSSATTYWPSHTGGYINGHFKCLHAHCMRRTDQDFLTGLGYEDPIGNYFDILSDDGVPVEPPAPGGALALDETTAPARLPFEAVLGDTFLDRPSPTWLIKGLIPHADIGMIYGDSGSGKTFIALDMAMAIARGAPWRDRPVEQGAVVYVCAEGVGGFRNRMAAYYRKHGLDPKKVPFYIITDVPSLLNEQDYKDLIRGIKRIGKPVKAVFVDTLMMAIAGGDENSAKDMTLAVNHMRRIAYHTQSIGVLVHHSGKDKDRGARGSSVLKGVMDFQLEVLKFDHSRVLRVAKQKDGADDESFAFGLESVGIGLDDLEEEITSCVVQHIDFSTKREDKAKLPRGGLANTAWALIRETADLADGRVPLGLLIDMMADKIVYDPTPGARDRRRDNAVRAVESLQMQGFVRFDKTHLEII